MRAVWRTASRSRQPLAATHVQPGAAVAAAAGACATPWNSARAALAAAAAAPTMRAALTGVRRMHGRHAPQPAHPQRQQSHPHSHAQPQPQRAEPQQSEEQPHRLRTRRHPFPGQSAPVTDAPPSTSAVPSSAPPSADADAAADASASSHAHTHSHTYVRRHPSRPSSVIPTRSRRPMVSHPEQSWLFAPYARANDYEGVFVMLEERARAALRAKEEAKLAEREARYAAARARGEEPEIEVDEHTLPWRSLTKKGRQRVRRLILSTSDSLRVLGTLPRQELVDCFQAFCVAGQEVGLEYVYRRMNQIGVAFDEELASRWMGGVVLAAMKRREQATMERERLRIEEEERKAGNESVGALDAGQQFIAATSSTHATPTPSSSRTPSTPATPSSAPRASKPPTSAVARPSSGGFVPFESQLAKATASTDPASVQALRPQMAHVGLLSTKLVRPQIELVMNWLQRYGLIPSRRVVKQCFEALAIDNDLHGSLAFIARLARMKYYVSGFTYSLLIEALSKHQNAQGALFVFLHMERAQFAPHAETFQSLIQSFARLGDYAVAYRLMQDMQRHKLHPDNATFGALIQACATGGRMDLALDMFNYFRRFYSHLTQSQRKHNVKDIKLLGKANVPGDGRVVTQLRLGREPFEALVHAHLHRGEMQLAIDRLNEMVGEDIRPSGNLYCVLLYECHRAAPPLHAEARMLWNQALSVGVIPNVSLYTCFMHHVESFSEQRELYEGMVRGGDAWAEAGADEDLTPRERRDRAMAASRQGGVVVSSPNSFHGPLQPTRAVFLHMLRAMQREGLLSELPWLLEQMREHDVTLGRTTRVEITRLLRAAGRRVSAQLFWCTVQLHGERALTDELIDQIVCGIDTAGRAQMEALYAEAQAGASAAMAKAEAEADAELAATPMELPIPPEVQAADYSVDYAGPTPPETEAPAAGSEPRATSGSPARGVSPAARSP